MIGKTISHYKILEKLGEGGMGVVYRARDTRLERDVALKFLSPHALGTEEDHARLLREARAAAALNHPSICTVHEIETAEGQTFIAMECVEGEDLRARLESGPLGVSGALRIAANIADGLSEAHAKSITHRDIKPANIVIAPTDRVKIMDFGLARLGGGAQLTKTGATLGTIAYMSPEQARGDPVDHRTDIWSLGVVLYEMLTGERPFRGDYDQAVIYSILNEEPEPLASIRSEVPAALDAILAVVLAKSPASRYQSAQELARDLRACRDELESPRSASDTPRSRPRPSIAVMPFADMSPEKDQEYFCDGMSEEIINALTQVEGLRVIARTSAFAFKGKNEDIREIGRKLSVATLLEGSVRKAGERLRITAQLVAVGDGAHLWSERYDRQLDDVFAIQDEIAVAIAERLKIELTPQEKRRLTAPRQVAPDVYEAYLRASQYLCRFFPLILRDPKHQQKVIELFQRVVDCAPDYALAWAGLADAYSFICRWVSPDISWVSRDTSCPRARAAAVRALELDDNLAEAHTAMGRVYLSADFDWKSAKREHMRAVELNPGSAEAHCEFGMHLVWEGWLDEGVAELRRAVELDPFDYYTNAALGLFLILARRHDEALEQVEAMGALFRGDELVERLAASCYVRKGIRLDEAIDTMERLGFFGVCTGTAYVAVGRRDNALEYIAKLAEEKRSKYAYCIATTYAALEDSDRALEWMEKTHATAPRDLLQVNTDMEFDFLRSDPRFKDLMRRAGIPSGQLG